VERLAASVNHAQRPAIYDESRGRFVFNAIPPQVPAPLQATAPVAPQATPQSATPAAQPPVVQAGRPGGTSGSVGKSAEVIEDELWAAFSGSNSRAGFAAYLREYPNGRYAPAARVQLEVLTPVDPPATPPKAAASAPAPTARPNPPAASPPAPASARPAPSSPTASAPAASAPAASAPAASGSPSSEPYSAAARRDTGGTSAPASASPFTRQSLNGRRFRGLDGQFDLTVLAAEAGLVVEAFKMTSGRFSGTQLRCGTFSSRIDIDEQLNITAWCNGAIPGSLRLTGRFPRIDIFTGGGFGGGTINLAEIGESKGAR
jgi:hypothetical protein